MSDFFLSRSRRREFVRVVVPFDALGDDELSSVVSKMNMAFFPRGERISAAGDPPAIDLVIIKPDSVKITLPDDQGGEILADLRGEDDYFGAASLLQGSQALLDVTARREDIIAFLLPATVFRDLYDTHPAFHRHFSFSLANNPQAERRAPDSNLTQIADDDGGLGLEAALKRSLVAELMTTNVLACLPPYLHLRRRPQHDQQPHRLHRGDGADRGACGGDQRPRRAYSDRRGPGGSHARPG